LVNIGCTENSSIAERHSVPAKTGNASPIKPILRRALARCVCSMAVMALHADEKSRAG
jgi:hypothetical protein